MKPIKPWLGGTDMPKETITISDVIGAGVSTTPGNNKNSITINLGVAYTGESYTQDALLFSTPGIISVPMGPGLVDNAGDFNSSNTSVTAAQAISIVRNDQHIVLGVRDTRVQFAAGNLKEGETCVYSPISSARTVYKMDGSINHITTAPDGSQVSCSIAPTSFTFFAAFGSIVFDATGFHVACASGARFDMGGLNAPGPLSGLGSFINMSAGSISLPAAIVNLGMPGPLGFSQVLYPLSPVTAPTPVQAGPVTTTPVTASQSVYVGL